LYGNNDFSQKNSDFTLGKGGLGKMNEFMEGVNVDEGVLPLRPYKLLGRGSGPSRSHRNALSPFNLRFYVLLIVCGKLVKLWVKGMRKLNT